MNDLRLIFRYGKPYRRDLWAAAGLIFIECIFEMVIPVLMSTLVDEGVPSHNMAIILRQGGPAMPPGSPTALRPSCAWPSTPPCRNSTLPTWTIFPLRPSSPA